MEREVFIGVDLGTSGIRAIAIDRRGKVRAETRAMLPAPRRQGARVEQAAGLWWDGVTEVLRTLGEGLRGMEPLALAVDGTSASLLGLDADHQPVGPALMYNDARSREESERIAALAPRASGAHGPTSALAKCLWLRRTQPRLASVLHQADWVTSRLCGRFGISDENNALKLGYDPAACSWPTWMEGLEIEKGMLPEVVPPGTPIGPLRPKLAQRLGLPEGLVVCAGTTDSTAAFLATGAEEPGEGVTALGSTLVVKILSRVPISAPEYGIYSHRLGDLWLAGGASNSGGAVLLDHFAREELAALSKRIDPDHPSGLDYYPLRAPGERFPLNDPRLPPRLDPRPPDDARFLHGMLEGMATIEQRGYRLLEGLGAPPLHSVRTTGGGATNAVWTRIRGRMLGVPMLEARHLEAAYGAALLAMRGVASGQMPDPRG